MQTAQGLIPCTQQGTYAQLRHAWECDTPLTEIEELESQDGTQAT